MSDNIGYRVIFAISLTVFVIGVIVSFFLKKRKTIGKYEWNHALHSLRQQANPWKRIIPALIAQGVREGVFAFIIGLMVFIATKNEMKLGNYSLITSAVALIAFLLAGKFFKPKYRSIGMLIGTLTLIVFILPFFWRVNFGTLLIFGIGTALMFPLFSLPMTSSVFDIIGKDEDSARHRVEYVVFRETGLNLGRIFGTVVFILVISWRSDETVLNPLLLFIGSFPILSWVFMRKLLRAY